jgi:hypothetical protein
MKDASGALDRVDGYIKEREELGTIDEPLLRIITQIMAVYLQLCLIYAKVVRNSKTASGQIKNGLKVMIRWDGGIGHCIEELDKLRREEVVTNVAAMRISDLRKTEQSSKKEDSLKLRSLLQVDKIGEDWNERQNRLEQESIPRIGDWLFDEAGEFQEWTSNVQQRPKDATLWLTGPAIYGKTHICCRAIKYLRDEVKMRERSRHCQISVAWFYHQEERSPQSKPLSESSRIRKVKKGAEEKKGTSNGARKEIPELRDILLTLIWQLAESDRGFQKHVIEQFRKSPRAFAKASQIWSDMIEAFCLQPQSGDSRPHCFFLVIDSDDALNDGCTISLSQTMQEYAKSLAKKILGQKRYRCNIRVMVTRTNDAPSHLKPREIRVPRDSRDSDVKIFIENHLENFLAWSKGSESYTLVCRLERRLISMFSKGETVNYHVLAGLLEEISRIGASLKKLQEFEKILDPNEIYKVFNSVIIPSQLRRLDEELEDEDKRILNDMISLLTCFKVWPTVEQLSTFLSLSRGSSFTKDIAVEIRKKYSHIMSITYDKYVQSDPLLWFFEEKINAQSWCVRVDNIEGAKIIQAPEVDLIKLKASTPDVANLPAIISELAKFYNTAHPKLQFDCHKSHIMIIKLLLSTICSEDHRERAAVKGLQGYTGMNLLWHLWVCNEHTPLKDVQDLESKLYIGKHLHHFFKDERSVTTWLSQSDPLYLREHTCAYLEDARVWLRDEQVWKGFMEVENRRSSSTDDRDVVPGAPSAVPPEFANNDYEEKTGTSLRSTQTEDTAEPASESQRKEASLEEGEPTEKTTTETEIPDAPVVAPDQLKSDVAEQPLLALVIRISASLWLEDFNWDASQSFLWLLTVAYEVSISYPLIAGIEGLIESERRLRCWQRSTLLKVLPKIRNFSRTHTQR